MKHVRSLNADEILQLVLVYLTEVSSLRDYDDVLMVLADMGRALTSSDRCSVWIINDDRTKIWTKVAQGIDTVELPIDSGVVGSSIQTEKRIIIDDVYKDDRFNPDIDKKTGYVTRSMMVIPMFNNDGEILGAFQVINHKGKKGIFDKSDMNRMMLASTYASEALVSAKLTEDIADTQKEVIFTMGAVGESRSKETGNHVKRVAEYSKLFALLYGEGEEKAELLRQVSPMHDIGKIAIPDAILNKPGRFNAQERKIMDTHAALGYDILKNSDRPLFKSAAIVAYQHHEKWNGTGYPNKLIAKEIHINGRITALADVFDALGSDRVYKKAWDDEKIFQLFKNERGEHFEPKLVDIFFDNLDKFLEIRDKFKDIYHKEETVTTEKVDSITILGAYGTKSKGFGTSAFLLNNANVIDAGNLLDPLEEKSADIENIWLTHSHLDHISDIAYILDNYFSLRKKTLNIIGLQETIETIKRNFLNDSVWPDFSKIHMVNSKEMILKYTEIKLEKVYEIGDNETIEAFKTDHTVPSCGYIVKKDDKSILITADTYSLDNILEIIDTREDIKSIIIECSFPSDMDKLAKESKHLTPKLLFDKLKPLKRDDVNLYINHIKPNFIDKIKNEIEKYSGKWEPRILKDNEIINFQ